MGIQEYVMQKVSRDLTSGVIEVSYKIPVCRGERSIVCYLLCADTGLLDNCLLLFWVRNRSSLQNIIRKSTVMYSVTGVNQKYFPK